MMFDIDKLLKGIITHNRASLSRAITLIESNNPNHMSLARKLLKSIPSEQKSYRIGITGAPGVGKSTLIESLGCYLSNIGMKIAVLAIDPSSTKTKGSILGDKTRMKRLSEQENVFIRPSPTAGNLGGVATRTRQVIRLCEAAGFNVIIVETVGTGQSEIAVSTMCDVFIVVALPNAGDELQAIKKGVLESADLICINKIDTVEKSLVRISIAEYQSALKILGKKSEKLITPIVPISALNDNGIDKLWSELSNIKKLANENNLFENKRAAQRVDFMWELLNDVIKQKLKMIKPDGVNIATLENKVKMATISPEEAVDKILESLGIKN